MANRRLVLSACFHALVGTSSYYFTSALNQIETHVEAFANASVYAHYGWVLDRTSLAWLWSTIAASCAMGAFVGAFLAKWPSELLGNRDTVMLVKNAVQIAAALLQFVAPAFGSVELLIVGRLVSGVAVVMAMFIPIFLAECSPTRSRGLIATLSYIGIPLWNLLGTVAGLPQLLGTADRWQYVLLLPVAPALVHLALTPLFPRSPKFLYISRRNRHDSRNSIMFYHGDDADSKAQLDTYEREAALADRRRTVGLRHIFQTRHLRWPFLISLIANLATDFGGSDIVSQYSTRFMDLVGVPPTQSPLFTVLLTQVPGMFISLVGLALIERCGRRLLMLLGVGMGTVATSCVFAAGLLDGSAAGALVGVGGLFFSVFGYYIGPCFVATLLPGELCPQISRSYTSGTSFALSWLPSVLIIVLYPPMQQLVGAFAVLPLVVLSVASFVWLAVYMPETKGRDVDEIVSAWRVLDDDRASSSLLSSDDSVSSYDSTSKPPFT